MLELLVSRPITGQEQKINNKVFRNPVSQADTDHERLVEAAYVSYENYGKDQPDNIWTLSPGEFTSILSKARNEQLSKF